MTNFVNFIEDRIRPVIIQAYLDGPGTEADFIGSDGSTRDYTKFGYLLSVYYDMINEETTTSAITGIVKTISAYQDDNNVPNYMQKSSAGYNILETMVYSERNNSGFLFSNLYDALPVEFVGFMNESLQEQASSTFGSAMHMMIEYGHAAGLNEIADDAFDTSKRGVDYMTLTPLMYALKKYTENIADSNREAVFNTVKSKYTLDEYNLTFGKNPSKTSSFHLDNDISRFIVSAYTESLTNGVNVLDSILNFAPYPATGMKAAVTKAEGLSKNSVAFDIGVYSGSIPGDNEVGYTPIFYYINRFKNTCDVNVLNKLKNMFSPLAISVDDGITEGYNAIGILAASMTLSDSGEWEQPELATWIKDRLSEIGATSGYELFVAAGNVRDMTGGKTINSFGALTNIFSTINNYHRKLKNEFSGAGEFTFDADPIITAILPDVAMGTLYDEWMIEYSREV